MSKIPVTKSSAFLGLIEELPVSTDAITSRTVFTNSLINQVLFSFDKGQGLSEHASPKTVVVQVLTGQLAFEVGGERHIMNPGDVVYLAPNDPHALEALEPTHLALTMITTPKEEEA